MDGPDPDESASLHKEAGSHGNPVRRPMNAFLIFCKRHRGVVREKNAHLDNRSVTKILGELWANLPQEEKSIYIDLAKQYKEAFMRANPDYKWHDPCRGTSLQGVPKSPTKLLPGQPLMLHGQSPVTDALRLTSGITPGKLADPSNMGGLSLLLMAGQHSLSPGSGEPPATPPSGVADGQEVDLECHELEEDLAELDDGPSSHTVDSGGHDPAIEPEDDKPPSDKTTSKPPTRGGTALFQLAEMCSSQFKAPTENKAEVPTHIAMETNDVTSSVKPPHTSSSDNLLTPPWTPKYEGSISPMDKVNILEEFQDKGMDLTMSKQKVPSEEKAKDKKALDLYCHEQVTPNTDYCRELDRRPLVDQIMRTSRVLPGCAFPQKGMESKTFVPDAKKGAAADLLRVLNAPTRVDPSVARPQSLPTAANASVKPERLGDLSQMMVERVIETVYSRDLLSCNPLEDGQHFQTVPPGGNRSGVFPRPNEGVKVHSGSNIDAVRMLPSHELERKGKFPHTLGQIQETLIRQAVQETSPDEQFAARVREQLKKVTAGGQTQHPGHTMAEKRERSPWKPVTDTNSNNSGKLKIEAGLLSQDETKGPLPAQVSGNSQVHGSSTDDLHLKMHLSSHDPFRQEVKHGLFGLHSNSSDKNSVSWDSHKPPERASNASETGKHSVKSKSKSDKFLTKNENIEQTMPPGGEKAKRHRKKVLSDATRIESGLESEKIKRKRKIDKKPTKSESDMNAVSSDHPAGHSHVEQQKDVSQEGSPQDSPEGPDSDLEGDASGLRKSKRSNRGQRYKALLSQGLLQPARRKYEAGDDNNNHQGSLASQSHDADGDFLPKKGRRRTMSENAKDDSLGEAGKRYKPGDFDLDAHIASLPVCDIHSNSGTATHPAAKSIKSRSKSCCHSDHSNRGDRGSSHPGGEESKAKSEQDGGDCLTIAELQCLTKSQKGPTPGSSTVRVAPPPVGSRKRKARKCAITHLIPVDKTADQLRNKLDVDNSKENTDSNNQMAPTSNLSIIQQGAALAKPAVDSFSLSALAEVAAAEQSCGDTVSSSQSENVLTVGCV